VKETCRAIIKVLKEFTLYFLNVNFGNDLKTNDFDVSFMVRNSQQKTSQKTDIKFILGKPGGTILIQNFVNNKKKYPLKINKLCLLYLLLIKL
jgi:hypothetical protein